MKHKVPKSVLPLPLELLRKAGYYPFTDPRTGEDSFVLRLGPDQYPRMHLYVEDEGEDWSFNVHIDQKKASYRGSAKHAGEYEGPLVEREIERICKWILSQTGVDTRVHQERMQKPSDAPKQPVITPPAPRKPFGGIF